jgi:hypothetical protein
MLAAVRQAWLLQFANHGQRNPATMLAAIRRPRLADCGDMLLMLRGMGRGEKFFAPATHDRRPCLPVCGGILLTRPPRRFSLTEAPRIPCLSLCIGDSA